MLARLYSPYEFLLTYVLRYIDRVPHVLIFLVVHLCIMGKVDNETANTPRAGVMHHGGGHRQLRRITLRARGHPYREGHERDCDSICELV
ncbi:hypothetical protein BVI1335_2300005 [Burkholderia vietnamiensis]|nr:hypothetical protein BVI1335_2300005 [Burkholderia vietnamiensis]